MITLTYGFGVALAAFAGVMAAPIYQVSPQMGSELIIVVFAVVVIGGMGSILGAIVTGFGLGMVEGLTKVFYPGGVEHRDLRHHGDRPAGPAGRPVRAESVMERVADPTRAKSARLAARTAGTIAFVVMVVGAGDRAVLHLSGVPDAGAVLCAVRLRLQSADRLCRAAVVRARALFRLGGLYVARTPPRTGDCRRSSRFSPARRQPRSSALVAGSLAIRRQGIYFAMITLALAQMMYFFALQAKFTGGEDGIQARAARASVRRLRSQHR